MHKRSEWYAVVWKTSYTFTASIELQAQQQPGAANHIHLINWALHV